MPANPGSLRITEGYRQRLLALRAQVARLVAEQWGRVTLQDLDGTFQRWLRSAVLVIAGGQYRSATLADLYLAAYLSSELGERVPPQGLDPARYAGQSTAGRPLAELLVPVLFSVKLALGQGRDNDVALASGRLRAARASVTEVTQASRGALDDAMAADDRVIGNRRVPSPGACGACLAAATGAIQTRDTPLKVHPSCRCVRVPVVRDAPERVRYPTGRRMFDDLGPAGQDALFGGRGGAAKADLIRSGAVPFEALISTDPLASGGEWITESSVKELLSR